MLREYAETRAAKIGDVYAAIKKHEPRTLLQIHLLMYERGKTTTWRRLKTLLQTLRISGKIRYTKSGWVRT